MKVLGNRFGAVRRALVVSFGLVLIAAVPMTGAAAARQVDGPTAASVPAGLTAQQSTELQGLMDKQLAEIGGTQVGPNKIQLDGGHVLVPVPGEKAARDLSQPGTAAAGCPYGNFCAYSEPNRNGLVYTWYYCRDYYMPWSAAGSWVNNQTPGTRAQFKDTNKITRWMDGGAPSGDWYAEWYWVEWIKPC